MTRVLPGLALLLLLGGAGLGFAYSTLGLIQEQTQLLSHLAKTYPAIQTLLEASQRMRSLLDLLVFTWGTSFALLGVGLLWHHFAQQKPDLERHLIQLGKTVETEQKNTQAHLESLLAPLTASSLAMASDLKELRAQTENATPSPSPHPMHNALTPLYIRSPVHTESPVHTASTAHSESPRLVLSGPVQHHDKEDEEFEPF